MFRIIRDKHGEKTNSTVVVVRLPKRTSFEALPVVTVTVESSVTLVIPRYEDIAQGLGLSSCRDHVVIAYILRARTEIGREHG